MIWRQDGDPPYSWYDWARTQRRFREMGSNDPTCYDLWRATAHESADLVCAILAGVAYSEGLGRYRGLWQDEPEVKEDRGHSHATYLETIKKAKQIREKARLERFRARHKREKQKAYARIYWLRERIATNKRIASNRENSKAVRRRAYEVIANDDARIAVLVEQFGSPPL